MALFKKKLILHTYDKENEKPLIKASICNGEQVAGFKNLHTGEFREVMLIRGFENLDAFAFECTQTLAAGGENVILPAKR